MTPERIAASQRATARARATLRPGDRLRIVRCGGREVTVTMTGWFNDHFPWITSATLDDIHALNIRKVNGVPTCFADPAGFVAPRITIQDRLRMRADRLRLRFAHWRAINLPAFSGYVWQPEYPDFSESYAREARLHASWLGRRIRVAIALSLKDYDDEVPF